MKKNTTLTVFTPTFNRSNLLKHAYESLQRQTCKDFNWLIIDDGSTDNTKEIVDNWILENNFFDIRYVYKENGGLHKTYNKAIELMETELCVCIDSDDFMPDNGVEIIISTWHKRTIDNVAGIVGLDYLLDNTPIGGKLPNIDKCHIYDLGFKYHHQGDKKIVMRVDLLKKVYPQPTYNNEKNFNPMYMISKIDLEYEWLIINENLCYVDYQENGMGNGIFKQFLNSPNSFAAIRIEKFKIPNPPKGYRLRQYIHLASSAILANNYNWLSKSPHPICAYLCLPLGFFLSRYIKYKAK